MRSSAEVVIIGGGIQGTSVAYHLAKRGIIDSVLVEMNYLGSGSSGRTAAMLMHQTGQEPTTRLAKVSIEEYLSYPDEFDIDISFHPVGSICFATEEEATERLRRRVDMQNKLGIETRELDASAVGGKVPFMNVDDILLAAYCPLDGYVDPYSVIQAYTKYARDRRVEILQGVQASGIRTEMQKVVGVETNKGFIDTRTVVNAAGALACQVGKWVRVDIPIKNYVRCIAFLAARPPFGEFPVVEDVETEWYLKPEGINIMVGVGPQTEVGDVPDTLQPGFEGHREYELAEYMMHRAPALADVGLMPIRWAGIRCMTLDELPILGPVDEVQGFLNCCGWSGFGVTLAPIGGKLLAEWIADGKTTTADINPFLLKRFQSK